MNKVSELADTEGKAGGKDTWKDEKTGRYTHRRKRQAKGKDRQLEKMQGKGKGIAWKEERGGGESLPVLHYTHCFFYFLQLVGCHSREPTNTLVKNIIRFYLFT